MHFQLFQHAPGVPKILVGNRLHLAYKRQVSEIDAETYALKNDMAFFEVSPLCDFNVTESFAELSRVALKRNGMNRSWGPNKGEKYFIAFYILYYLTHSHLGHTHELETHGNVLMTEQYIEK